MSIVIARQKVLLLVRGEEELHSTRPLPLWGKELYLKAGEEEAFLMSYHHHQTNSMSTSSEVKSSASPVDRALILEALREVSANDVQLSRPCPNLSAPTSSLSSPSRS